MAVSACLILITKRGLNFLIVNIGTTSHSSLHRCADFSILVTILLAQAQALPQKWSYAMPNSKLSRASSCFVALKWCASLCLPYIASQNQFLIYLSMGLVVYMACLTEPSQILCILRKGILTRILCVLVLRNLQWPCKSIPKLEI